MVQGGLEWGYDGLSGLKRHVIRRARHRRIHIATLIRLAYRWVQGRLGWVKVSYQG